MSSRSVEWIPCTPDTAAGLHRRAVEGGTEKDGTALWVIRAKHNHGFLYRDVDLVPGKLAIKHNDAWISWHGSEYSVKEIEVLCADPDIVCWVECKNGKVPRTAVQGGYTSAGEPLYIGRAWQGRSLALGKVHPTHKALYISWDGGEVTHRKYEVLCTKDA